MTANRRYGVFTGCQRRLVRRNLKWRDRWRRYDFQPKRRPWPHCDHAARLRQCGSERQNFGYESNRRHCRKLQRRARQLHNNLAFPNQDHHTNRRDNGEIACHHPNWHADEQRGLPSNSVSQIFVSGDKFEFCVDENPRMPAQPWKSGPFRAA